MDNNELYHYGVLGMHWGHRKAQSTTPTNAVSRQKEITKKYKKDADYLSKAMANHLDSTNEFQRSLKQTYLVDDKGNISGRGITTYDVKKYKKKNQNEKEYLKIKKNNAV